MSFPYFRDYSDLSAHDLFEWLRAYTPTLTESEKWPAMSGIYGLMQPCAYQGKYLTIDSSDVDYNYESITDFFTEEARMQARKHYAKKSPLQLWKSYPEKQKQCEDLIVRKMSHCHCGPSIPSCDSCQSCNKELRALREWVFHIGHEVTLFRVTWAKGIYSLFCQPGDKVLDPCAGWGDRCIAALACGLKYQGYDPSTKLVKGHAELLNTLDSDHTSSITCEPFEIAELTKNEFDFVFTSPPFFGMELYSNEETQSNVHYKTYDAWVRGFLFQLVCKSVHAVKQGGYMAFYISDYSSHSKVYYLCESLSICFLEVGGASFKGCIALRGESQRTWPVWIWQKN